MDLDKIFLYKEALQKALTFEEISKLYREILYNEEEIEEIETLEIDFKDTDELELALEVSSKKAIYLIDDLIKHLFELQQENKKYKEVISKAIEYINNHDLTCNENWLVQYEKELLDILKEVE